MFDGGIHESNGGTRRCSMEGYMSLMEGHADV
jgi:hypothetical protein